MPVDGAPQCRCSSPQSASGATVVIAHGPASPRIGLGNTSGRARARSPTLLARAPLRVLRWSLQNTTTAWQENSAIEWTGHTFNPWWGCTKVSPACDHCYAEVWAKRTGHSIWGADAPRRQLSNNYWNQPLRWDRAAALGGGRARVFCASMADVFESNRELDSLRARLWALVERTPNLDWLLLTKRPHLARRLAPWTRSWPRNIWLGATVENQHFADRRIRYLLDVPCQFRFLSCEPLLGPVDLSEHIGGLHWIIAGGESGGRSRPTHPDWIRGLRDQCVSARVAFHFKQWGNWYPQEAYRTGHERPITSFVRMSKKSAGRILDGRTWDELPHGYSERSIRPWAGEAETASVKTAS